jgi:uncharacterized protein YutE (UPF0331/DUF86 family)
LTDATLVTRKLALLREHLARLRRRRPASLEELRGDDDRIDAIAMSVLVVVQEATDVAFHIASDEGWGIPATYRDGFELLAKKGVILHALAAELAGAARLRNRIAHGYASLDVETLWRDLPLGVASFEAYATAIAAYVAAPTAP